MVCSDTWKMKQNQADLFLCTERTVGFDEARYLHQDTVCTDFQCKVVGHSRLKTPALIIFNPLNPNKDQHTISPCNINAYSTPEVMRIKDMITQGGFS